VGWWKRLSHTRLVPAPVGRGSSHSTWSWSPAGPCGQESSCPMCSWGSARPEGQWARGGGYPGELWDQLWAGVQCRWVAGIPVVMDLAAWLRVGYPSMVWVQRLEASVAEVQVVDLAWPKRQGFCRVWVWCGAVAWCNLKGREPGRMEQWLCRPIGQGLASWLFFYFFFLFLLLFTCVYKAWFISPPCPHPLPYHPLCLLPLPPINTQHSGW
jgi:hypothetical protein